MELIIKDVSKVYDILIKGIRGYYEQYGFEGVTIGISGGLDSAVVTALAAKAVGPWQVHGLAMPSVYSSPDSEKYAYDLCSNLDVHIETVDITPLLNEYKNSLLDIMGPIENTLVEENLQARIRGNLLMAHSNKRRTLVLATGNRSEALIGYCTLYGDTVGGLAPIGNMFKTDVYVLAAYMNKDEIVIPREIIARPPSAELREGQKDEDELPSYEQLDFILDLYIEDEWTIEAITRSVKSRGWDVNLVLEIINRVDLNSFKRKQFPPAIEIE